MMTRPGTNIRLSQKQWDLIRSFELFDAKMFLSEINDRGWDVAKLLIPLIVKCIAQEREKNENYN